MGCTSCSPNGCGNKGHCATGSCNKMNTYDWVNVLELSDPLEYNLVEVSFKNGSHKEFFINENRGYFSTGDDVLVEAATGYDIGKISLMGDLVRLQMKKKFIQPEKIATKIIRKANERDLERLYDLRIGENAMMVKARAIAYSHKLDMKIGDVAYQGDGRKATFYYTANGRIDFRELVKSYAKEFKIKIEMRQIGSRQESALIGGLGSCGRELCCSTWLSDFRSVNTSAARYQNISINQTKLSGQCGRLKCCLNYELDSYMDAIQHFPNRADILMTKKGRANLVKTDIFRGLMYYTYEDITMRGVFHALDKERVKEILKMNAQGSFPEDLSTFTTASPKIAEEKQELNFADVTGQIELPSKSKKKKKPGFKNQNNQGQRPQEGNNNQKPDQRKPQGGNPNNQRQDQRKPQDGNPNQRPDQGRPQNNQQRPPQANTGPANITNQSTQPSDPATNQQPKEEQTKKKFFNKKKNKFRNNKDQNNQ
jgi:cell fate regulator YaaT (PSP1 superfamily)